MDEKACFCRNAMGDSDPSESSFCTSGIDGFHAVCQRCRPDLLDRLCDLCGPFDCFGSAAGLKKTQKRNASADGDTDRCAVREFDTVAFSGSGRSTETPVC